jgi:hypothetical protein
MSSRRTFTSEYKRECAELVIKHGYQVKEAAQAKRATIFAKACFGHPSPSKRQKSRGS